MGRKLTSPASTPAKTQTRVTFEAQNKYVPASFQVSNTTDTKFSYPVSSDKEFWLIQLPQNMTINEDFEFSLDSMDNEDVSVAPSDKSGKQSNFVEMNGKRFAVNEQSVGKLGIFPVFAAKPPKDESESRPSRMLNNKISAPFARVLSFTQLLGSAAENQSVSSNSVQVQSDSRPIPIKEEFLKYRHVPFGCKKVPDGKRKSSSKAESQSETNINVPKKKRVKV